MATRTPAAGRHGLLRSGLTVETDTARSHELAAWFGTHRERGAPVVRKVALAELAGFGEWRYVADPLRITHRSGRFFAVEGYRVEIAGTGRTTRCFDQPLVNQPEVGVLGFLSTTFDGVRHLLVQHKMEPGNPRWVQLAPTVQATESNYTRVHGGSRTRYLEYFTDPDPARVLVDERQPEHAHYYLHKLNRNVVVDVDDTVPAHDGFRWMTLGQLRRLLAQPHAVNMDARSVLCCLPLADTAELPAMNPGREPIEVPGGVVTGFGRAVLYSSDPAAATEHSDDHLARWWTELTDGTTVRLTRRPVDRLAGWRLDGDALRPATGRHEFSVLGVSVRARTREVTSWTQPMLARYGTGLLGLLTQERHGTLHVLLRAGVGAGCGTTWQLEPTVVCHQDWATGVVGQPFARWFADPADPNIRVATMNSEEGGRFWRFDYRYAVVEAPPGVAVELPPGYRWMSLAQVATFRARGVVGIEARNILACLHPGLTG